MAKRDDQITDLGEKIGGARKDRAVKTGPRARKPAPVVDAGPAWARRYVAAENIRAGQPTGTWSLLDTGKKGHWGGHASIGRDFPSKAAAEAAIPLAAVSRTRRTPSGTVVHEIVHAHTRKVTP